MTNRPKQLYYTGDGTEYFGGMPGEYDPIPARDLTLEETASLTEAQWNVIDSPAGRRLYRRTEPAESKSSTISASGTTDATSAAT